MTDSDEIKVKLETWLITSVDEGSEAGLPAQAYIDVAHEVVEYDESN